MAIFRILHVFFSFFCFFFIEAMLKWKSYLKLKMKKEMRK